MNEDKKKQLEQAILAIEKQFGKGSIMKLSDGASTQIDVIPTGCLTLDYALGIGGVPRGRIIEIYGPESSGKTGWCSFQSICFTARTLGYRNGLCISGSDPILRSYRSLRPGN